MRTLTLTLAGWLALAGGALGQCVLDSIRVEHIQGRLLFGFQKKYRVLDNGEIQLLDPINRRTVLASAKVEQDGHFEVAKAKPGKFVLSARSEGLIPAYVDVTITKSKPSRNKQLILVILGADATIECGGASISVKSIEDVDHVLSTAKRPSD